MSSHSRAGTLAAVLADSVLLPQCVYRPGSFSGLMLLYESNYLKLGKTIGLMAPRVAQLRWVSRVRGDSELHLEWLGSEPYTSTLRLTYWLRDPDGSARAEPNTIVRIYHDAAQAEALPDRDVDPKPQGFAALRRRHELQRRWQRNMMLNKWLDYLLDRGHGFY